MSTRELVKYGLASRIVDWQQECDEPTSMSPQSPAILRQHSRSSAVKVLSGSKHAIKGKLKRDIASKVAASFPANATKLVYRRVQGSGKWND